MRLKSFFASTVEAALATARQELGPDAMLVDSRKTGIEARHLGEYEVVCAVFAPKAPSAGVVQPEEGAVALYAPSGYRAPSLDKLSHEVSELKRYMERMSQTISRTGAGFSNLKSHPELADAFSQLTAAEVDSSVAHDIVTRLAQDISENSDVRVMVAAELEKLLMVDARLGKPGSRQSVVALIGPPGCGKTTCLVKMAAQFGLATRRPTQILTLDTFRVAAADQLRSYAAILGIGFQVVHTPIALAQALEEHRHKDLVLIDTPGFGKQDSDDAQDIARYLATQPDIDTHLVLPISMKVPDLKKAADLYRIFRPSKLLFTKLDETVTFGPVLNLVLHTGKPVSFLSYGQQIPEDFEAATKQTLLELILRKEAFEENTGSAVAAA